jgi:hypothetical protein
MHCRITPFISRDQASWTSVLFTARYQTLFGVIGNIRSKYWEDLTDFTITTGHQHTLTSCLVQRCKEKFHAVVKKAMHGF